VLTLYPPLYVLWRGGSASGFTFIGGDAFLYLTIARNSTFKAFTYDGTTVTNGFHPLWQWLMTLLFHGTPASAALGQTRLVTLLSLGFVTLGIVLASLALLRFTGSRLLALLTVPGLFYVFVGSLLRCHPAWSDVSGMECCLSVAFGGAFLWILARHLGDETATLAELLSRPRLHPLFLQLGLLLPFIFLARLDDVFLVFTLGLAVLATRVSWASRLRVAAVLCGPSAIVLLAYTLYNKATAGTFLPISGMTKAGFVFARNLYMTLAGLFPIISDIKNALVHKQSAAASLGQNLFRGIEMLYPVFLGAVFVYFHGRRERRSARTTIYAAMATYILLKAGYNTVNVHLFHQSSWYYGFAILMCTFFGVLLLAPGYRVLFTSRAPKWALLAGYSLYVAVAASRYCSGRLYENDQREYQFWKDRDVIATELRKQVPDPKLIAFDDGIGGFAMPFPTIHGFVFAGDLETARARLRNQLLAHAYARGHRIITSGDYFQCSRPLHTSDEVRAFLKDSILEDAVQIELDNFDYRLLYVHEATQAPFIEFWPKADAKAKPGQVTPSSPPTDT
jgi:hypothetical protein